MSFPRVRPVGDQALTLELGDAIDPAVNRRVRGLDRALLASPFTGFREAVPTYRSLLVVYDRARIDYDGARQALLELEPLPEDLVHARPAVVIPGCYGGEHGPDLEPVAAQLGLRPAELVERHTAAEYTAYMLGFLPGFAYLGLLPKDLETPRRASPRPRVPAGSIGIAARQTGVYPTTCPGGWNLIGRTSVRLFTVGSDPPALILPGDRVRFTAVEELPSFAAAATPLPAFSPSIEVLEPGLQTTVQDVGRFGQRRLGVGWAGAADAAALAIANRAVGNPAGAAALECTLTGPSLRFLASTRFAIAGGDLNPVLERSDLGLWPVPAGVSVLARAGNVVRFAERRSGCRAYVAFGGGLDVPIVMGSRAT
ncbi:MAG TPA: 5-oxoprolinase subunit PxpB, partial [Thermoleophilia bacterium]|nr:5-oxoprolinase subunit PxpB [Thermoleophilia bacterium]